jgi:hypothetical protein
MIAMPFNPGLRIGQTINNAELVEIFQCGNMGGMRRSRATNTLVIVSDYTKGLYQDKWILESIQGFVELGSDNRPCYLFNGQWYVFDEKFTDLLTKEFEELYINQAEAVASLTASYGLRFTAANEEEYNSNLHQNSNIIVAHTVLVDNLELADSIFWDDHSIYLMHNKTRFSGTGARDVTNQVLTAAEYLQQRLARHDRLDFLRSYYDKIRDKYHSLGLTLNINKETFVAVLNSGRTFHYITGYIQNYSSNSDATYAKYLTVETAKRLSAKGYKYSVMSTSP